MSERSILRNVDSENSIEVEINSVRTKEIFKNDLIVYGLKFYCSVYFVVELQSVFSTISLHMSSSTSEENQKNCILRSDDNNAKIFFMIPMRLFNIIIVFISRFLNYKYRGFNYTVATENVWILYTMAMPFASGTIIYLLLAVSIDCFLVQKVMVAWYNTPSIVMAFVDMFFYVTVIVTMIDNGGRISTGENYVLKVANTSSLFVTVVGLVNILIHESILNGLDVFETIINIHYNVSFYNCTSFPTVENLYITAKWTRCFVVAYVVVCICYLAEPLRRNLEILSNILIYDFGNNDNNDGDNGESAPSLPQLGSLIAKVDIVSLLSGIFIITISSSTIYFGITTATKHSFAIVNLLFVSVYLVTSAISIAQLAMTKSWRPLKFISSVDRLLLWSTCFVFMLATVAIFFCSCNSKACHWTSISHKCVLLCQLVYICCQTLLTGVSLAASPLVRTVNNRRWDPAFISLCCHVGILMFSIYNFRILKETQRTEANFSYDLLCNSVKIVTAPFVMAYNCYIVVHSASRIILVPDVRPL